MRALVFALLAACSYAPQPAGGPSGDDGPPSDMPGDTTMVACAIDGTRACADATHAGHCQNGQVVADRDCPPSSTCVMGRCAPPAGATACSADGDCAGNQVCDVYVSGNSFDGFCTDPIGTTTSTCTAAGNDPACDSGICAVGGGKTVCLSPCHAQNDCNGSGGLKCVGISSPSTIEGLPTGQLKHCVPN